MSNIAIRVEGLGKQYHIGGAQRTYDRFGEQVVDALAAPFRRARKILRGEATGAAELDETFWALRDVNFEIEHGEVVGVIGRNGAGKSTLLKILSRITEPTSGRAELYGRVGSLLEVGTGFHPELTGRENIFLNGAILGMKRAEIQRKFDEIVAFAEIGKFIDTPVKHYSSGMYVRLAFSVAAHLEPEILLVDEVLAVGDIAFQKKCLGKMGDVAQEGRTVLFVSHNMGLVQSLCRRGILLRSGEIATDAPVTEAVNAYLDDLQHVSTQDIAARTDRRGRGKVRLVGVEIYNGSGERTSTLTTGRPARFVFRLDGLIGSISCLFDVYDHLGRIVAKFQSDVVSPEDTADPAIGNAFVCEVDELMLVAGQYRINVLIRGGGEWQDFVEGAALFNVETGLLRGRPIKPSKRNPASVCMPHRWARPG
ncbi:MAG: ABC transporter ATP-binding protein [Caldilineae bacterium]|nr:MAG: ABC transporter ATP-binding protein [Caldilineae bacterium]